MEINSRSLVGSGDPHDTIGINLESDLNLGDTTRSGRNASKLEFAEVVVVLGERTFAFENLDQDNRLYKGRSESLRHYEDRRTHGYQQRWRRSGSSW